MAVFKDKNLVEELFGELWSKMINETEFGPRIKKDGLSIMYKVNDPDVVMFVDGDGPLFGAEAEKKVPMVIMKMSGDTVHQFWLKKLNIPKALALRHIKAKGPVVKVLQLLPMLKPGQVLYPGYCEKYNLPME
jgi:putative sterol carrier protein